MRRVAIVFILGLVFSCFALAQGNPEDDRIYDQVRLRLASNPDVKGGAIEVKVEQGVVTLMGKVRTEKAKKKAENLASKVKGVKKVVNQLLVSPT
ncbi:MAG: BON domain-containing protein [Bryobacteraceae bacterium]|nr:BON domain-containing protein [Bryobacteraceae bacterium]MDW8377613.1 BON domain-containing protein [Bryobacterales bacterium]